MGEAISHNDHDNQTPDHLSCLDLLLLLLLLSRFSRV